jgi:hypothetical protein
MTLAAIKAGDSRLGSRSETGLNCSAFVCGVRHTPVLVKKIQIESQRATIARVKKEMAFPRVTKSVRDALRHAGLKATPPIAS